jgi:hypothetical protein
MSNDKFRKYLPKWVLLLEELLQEAKNSKGGNNAGTADKQRFAPDTEEAGRKGEKQTIARIKLEEPPEG